MENIVVSGPNATPQEYREFAIALAHAIAIALPTARELGLLVEKLSTLEFTRNSTEFRHAEFIHYLRTRYVPGSSESSPSTCSITCPMYLAGKKHCHSPLLEDLAFGDAPPSVPPLAAPPATRRPRATRRHY